MKFQKLILINPCQKIKLSRVPIKFCVTSEEQTEQLIRFIKAPTSNPEWAMILSLVLFFGFTPGQLAHAQCVRSPGSLSIVLRRKPTSYGRRYYNREQILKFPQEPQWLSLLQNKFYAQWCSHYEKTKKTYPYKPLLLPYNHNYNRPLSADEVGERIKRASFAATGHYIPARILRQTCGHLYAKNGDASMLSRLGWSTQFAFCYTWVPRTYYSTKV